MSEGGKRGGEGRETVYECDVPLTITTHTEREASKMPHCQPISTHKRKHRNKLTLLKCLNNSVTLFLLDVPIKVS